MSVTSYIGVVRAGHIQLTEPIELRDGTAVYVVPAIYLDEQQARRKATGWLVDHVSLAVGAYESGTLYSRAGRLVWRFEAYLTKRGTPPAGPLGEVEVDALTGEVLGDDNLAQEIMRRGEALAATLSTSEK